MGYALRALPNHSRSCHKIPPSTGWRAMPDHSRAMPDQSRAMMPCGPCLIIRGPCLKIPPSIGWRAMPNHSRAMPDQSRAMPCGPCLVGSCIAGHRSAVRARCRRLGRILPNSANHAVRGRIAIVVRQQRIASDNLRLCTVKYRWLHSLLGPKIGRVALRMLVIYHTKSTVMRAHTTERSRCGGSDAAACVRRRLDWDGCWVPTMAMHRRFIVFLKKYNTF